MRPERQAAEEAMAQRYAEGIRTNGDHTGEFWRDLNWEIVERWSRTALQRVKARAWQIIECAHSPVSRDRTPDGWRCSMCGQIVESVAKETEQ